VYRQILIYIGEKNWKENKKNRADSEKTNKKDKFCIGA
jgi:hypothetical protein